MTSDTWKADEPQKGGLVIMKGSGITPTKLAIHPAAGKREIEKKNKET